MTKEELEQRYPIGSMVDLLGSQFKGKIIGNFRLMKPVEKPDITSCWDLHIKRKRNKDDETLREWISEAKNANEGSAEWFIDVEVLGEIKPLNIMMLG